MNAKKNMHIEITRFVQRVLLIGLTGSNGGIHPTGLTNITLAAFAEGCNEIPRCQVQSQRPPLKRERLAGNREPALTSLSQGRY